MACPVRLLVVGTLESRRCRQRPCQPSGRCSAKALSLERGPMGLWAGPSELLP
mgnify:CR=1 FL=1